MSTATPCPHCGSLIRFDRHGVALTAIKAQLFDAVQRHPGISTAHLAARISGLSEATTRVHISQINDLFGATDIRIRGRAFSGYRIEGLPA